MHHPCYRNSGAHLTDQAAFIFITLLTQVNLNAAELTYIPHFQVFGPYHNNKTKRVFIIITLTSTFSYATIVK